jgi:uncharacterized protein
MKVYRSIPAQPDLADLPPLAEPAVTISAQPFVIRVAIMFTLVVLVAITMFLVARFFTVNDSATAKGLIDEALSSKIFWAAIAVGFLAQAIDGALGMAYGVTSTTFLLASGASPAMASASVHIAEVFTTGVSGVAHARLGNVDKKLFLRLLIPGMIGGVLGAYVITQIDGKLMKPYISAYLLIMGLYVLSKAWSKIKIRKEAPKHVGKLAIFGGFVDAAGGGGWGPVVTTTLVNFAEFFLALTGAISFTLMVGMGVWTLVVGLVIGGLFAAPFAALAAKHFSARTLLILVGSLIMLVSAFNLYKALA